MADTRTGDATTARQQLDQQTAEDLASAVSQPAGQDGQVLGADGTMIASVATFAETTVDGKGDEGVGLPQLDPEGSYFVSQLFWLFVTFGFLYFMMSRVALPKIANVLKDREDRIALDLERAEQFKERTQEAIEAYETALANARSRAHKTIDETKRRVSADLEARRKESDARIEQQLRAAEANLTVSKDKALTHVRGVAAALTQDIVAKVGGAGSDDKNSGKNIDDAIAAELSNRGMA